MPYCTIARVKTGRQLIRYCEGNGKGHNNNDHRNVVVSGVNIFPGGSFADQMATYWKRARRGHHTQLISVLQSFSAREADPDDPLYAELVNKIGVEFASEHYPDRQVLVFTQRDGRSGLLHNHILINDCAMSDARGCDNAQYHFATVKEWTNAKAAEYLTLDFGNANPKDLQTQTEREKVAAGEWSVRDEIKKRVRDAMGEAVDEDDFVLLCNERGVLVERKSSKKYGEYFTYEYVAPIPEGEKAPVSMKARSYKLGDDYGPKALLHELTRQPMLTVKVGDGYAYQMDPHPNARMRRQAAERRKQEAERRRREEEERKRRDAEEKAREQQELIDLMIGTGDDPGMTHEELVELLRGAGVPGYADLQSETQSETAEAVEPAEGPEPEVSETEEPVEEPVQDPVQEPETQEPESEADAPVEEQEAGEGVPEQEQEPEPVASLPPGYDPTIRVIYASELEDDGIAEKLRRKNEERLAKIRQQAEKLQGSLPQIDLSRINFDGIGDRDGDGEDDGEEVDF